MNKQGRKEIKRKVLKVAKTAIVVTHKISIFGLKAYLNYHTGEVTSTIKIIRIALIALLAIHDYYFNSMEEENKAFDTPFRIVEKYDKERVIV